MNNSEIKDGKLTERGKQAQEEPLEKYPYRLGDGTWVSVGGSLVGKGSDPELYDDEIADPRIHDSWIRYRLRTQLESLLGELDDNKRRCIRSDRKG